MAGIPPLHQYAAPADGRTIATGLGRPARRRHPGQRAPAPKALTRRTLPLSRRTFRRRGKALPALPWPPTFRHQSWLKSQVSA